MRRLWWTLAFVLVSSFLVLGWVGTRVYQQAPPIPALVVTTSGRVLFERGEVATGQDVWRGFGGMELGSIWGHGAYVAPDWTADWLHRELVAVLDAWARRDHGAAYADLAPELAAGLRERLRAEYHRNTYDAATGTITVSDIRGAAIDATATYYAALFRDGRADYALPSGTVTDGARAHALGAFFFWSAWAAATDRPGEDVTYTSNWPHEPLIDNRPTADAMVWTGVSILVLLAGIGGLAFWYATKREEEPPPVPREDPFLGSKPDSSQHAVVKYFWVVCALMLVQIAAGIVTAHYGVEGTGFYGIPLDRYLPYAVIRTWHVQLGIFWIATAWLGAGLAIAPTVGVSPRYQRLGVNVLFVALLLVVAGSLAGQAAAIAGKFGSDRAVWWLGHSGYEYIDLGRIFQLALMAGLVLWVFLVGRALWPALARKDAQRPLLIMLLISTIAIGGFYFAALGAGRHTNLAITEYWRWWVVHLWVEGFFEVFATVIIAFLFVRLGLVHAAVAGRTSVVAASIFLSGGVIGTLHHLYFSGTPTIALALGSVFSALEVVPLLFLGHDAWGNWRLSRTTPWMRSYRWPIYFFIAVAFWNLVGAGLFGFMINPPIALYYMQGLNTTAVHAHTALFGVYGMLGMGLILFTVKAIVPNLVWPDRLLRFSFWSINLGLAAMTMLSVLPVGLLQTWAAVSEGYWYARSAEFLGTPLMDRLRWLRAIGDTVFAVGIVAFVVAVLQLTLRRRATGTATDLAANPPAEGKVGS